MKVIDKTFKSKKSSYKPGDVLKLSDGVGVIRCRSRTYPDSLWVWNLTTLMTTLYGIEKLDEISTKVKLTLILEDYDGP